MVIADFSRLDEDSLENIYQPVQGDIKKSFSCRMHFNHRRTEARFCHVVVCDGALK